MQRLHLVGFTTDFEGLIFSVRKGAKTGSFVVPVTDDLRARIAEARRLRNGSAAGVEDVDSDDDGSSPSRPPRPESALTPREIQTRLRGGHSIEEVAVEAGVEVDWVERFAAPIVAEQARVVDRALSLTFTKPRRGGSALSLGASVARNAGERGADVGDEVFGDAWDAYHLRGTVWMVRYRFRARGRLHVAEWELDLLDSQLIARNRLASELGHVEPRGRRLAAARRKAAAKRAVAAKRVPAAKRKAPAKRAKAPAKRAKAAAKRA